MLVSGVRGKEKGTFEFSHCRALVPSSQQELLSVPCCTPAMPNDAEYVTHDT